MVIRLARDLLLKSNPSIGTACSRVAIHMHSIRWVDISKEVSKWVKSKVGMHAHFHIGTHSSLQTTGMKSLVLTCLGH